MGTRKNYKYIKSHTKPGYQTKKSMKHEAKSWKALGLPKKKRR